MDEPLFGEQRRHHKIASYVCGGLVSVFVVETLIASLALSGKDSRNILLAILVVLLSVLLGILVWWYRQGDLDPKFIYLNIFLGFVVLLSCGFAHFYIFAEPPGYKCYSQDPPLLYYQVGDVCLPYCAGQGMCLKFETSQCLNCTALSMAADTANQLLKEVMGEEIPISLF